MKDAKPVSTLLAYHFKLSTAQCPKTDDEARDKSGIPYASAVGCMMYAMVCTRSDLAQSVGVMSKFLENPGRQHWDAVKWIFRYLRGTTSHGIMLGKHGDTSVAGYVDADYAEDLDSRRSTTGYV